MSRSAGFAPALPALILLSVIFLFPVARFLGFSVEAGNFDWYAQALGKELYLRVLWDTFEIAALVTLLLPAAGVSAGVPDRHHDAFLGHRRLRLRAAAAVDQRAGAHLRLDGAARSQRRAQPPADRRRRHHVAAAAAAQLHGRADRHGARAAALHGAADLWRGAAARPGDRAGGAGPGRLDLAHLLAHLRAAHDERHLRRAASSCSCCRWASSSRPRCWVAAG